MLHRPIRTTLSTLILLGFVAASGCSSPSQPLAVNGSVSLSVSPTQVAQGDTIAFYILLPIGPLGGDTLLFALTDGPTFVDTLIIPSGTVDYTGKLIIPPALPDGKLYIRATIPALKQTALDSVVILDNVPPALTMPAGVFAPPPLPQFSMNLLGSPFSYLGGVELTTGTADTLLVIATDNHALGWVGWTLGPPANFGDSVLLRGTLDTIAFPLVVPNSLAGTTPSLSLFVRDADGNTITQAFGQVSVAQRLDHPAISAPLTAAPSDLTFDMKRKLVYVAEPDSMRIAVLSLLTMSYQAPIPFSSRPVRMDVTPGGDSLLVVFDSSATLAIVDIANAGRPFTTLALSPIFDPTISPYKAGWASGVRVAADNRAIITMYSPDDSTDGAIELNLLTESQRVVAHPSYGYHPQVPGVIRSPNADSVIFGAFYYQRSYDATTHNYTSDFYDYNNLGPPVTSTNNGTTHYLVGTYLLETFPGLNGLGSFGIDVFYSGTIAPDGSEAYRGDSMCGNPPDQMCVDTAHGVVLHYKIPVTLNAGTTVVNGQQAGQLLDYSMTPSVGNYWAVSPDGKTLIGVGTNAITALDLTHSVPSGARVLASRGRGQGGTLVASGRPSVRPGVRGIVPPATQPAMTIRLKARTAQESAGDPRPRAARR